MPGPSRGMLCLAAGTCKNMFILLIFITIAGNGVALINAFAKAVILQTCLGA